MTQPSRDPLPFRALKWYARKAPFGRGAYPVARAVCKVIPDAARRGIFTTPDGVQLELNLNVYPDLSMAFGLYELDTARLMMRLLRPGGRFVDVGANLGYFSLLAARAVGAKGRVDAFEPDPLNRARLEAHVQLNAPLPQVRIHPLAASDREEITTLYHPVGGNHGLASVHPKLVPGGQGFPVRSVRVAAHLSKVPDLVKVDVEGAELAVVDGMRGWLAAPPDKAPDLIIEHNPHTAAAGGWTPGTLLKKVMQFQPKYTARWVGWRMTPVTTPEQLDSIKRQGNVWLTCRPPVEGQPTTPKP